MENEVPVVETTQEPEVTDSPQVPETKEPEEKSYTEKEVQEKIESAIQKRLARERRKLEREIVERTSAQVDLNVDLDPTQFETTEDYIAARVELEAARKLNEKLIQEEIARQTEEFESKADDAREKYADFDEVAFSKDLRITHVMREAIQTAEAGAEVLYYLGNNPKEATRISKLSPVLQTREIWKLEAKIEAGLPAKPVHVSKAPPPIAPVSIKSSSATYDLDDPRSVSQLGIDRWIELRNEQESKRR